MGSPMSSAIAELVMENIENKILKTVPYDIKFSYRYVYDVSASTSVDKITDLHNRLYNYNNRIQFTIEREINN